MHTPNRLLVATLLMGLTGFVQAAIIHNELCNGDLSGDPAIPTVLNFSLGSNTVLGSVQDPDDVRDYFTFEIGEGQQLSSISVTAAPPDNLGFVSLNLGSSSFIPGIDTIGNFLGADHFRPTDLGADLLALLAEAPLGGTGFSTPLGTGTYTFLVQQTGVELNPFGFDFQVTAVPLPPAMVLLLCALASLGIARRKAASYTTP